MSKNLKVLSREYVEALLSEDTRRELDRIGIAKEKLARKNLDILRTSKNPVLIGVSELEAGRILRAIKTLDPTKLDGDISYDNSRGIIRLGNDAFFWTIDYLDEDTLAAKIKSELFALNIIRAKLLY